MSPQLMREKQAEIAEAYGVMLDATTRLERGIFEKPAGIEEIYRAKEEARLPREIVMTAQESAIAQAQVVARQIQEGAQAERQRLTQQHHTTMMQAQQQLEESLAGAARHDGNGQPAK